jgi:hypothetical protein
MIHNNITEMVEYADEVSIRLKIKTDVSQNTQANQKMGGKKR